VRSKDGHSMLVHFAVTINDRISAVAISAAACSILAAMHFH
jgi:hypothetical protein